MFWINLLILLAASAGHAELWVTLVNRIYGLKYRHDSLHRLRRLHDLMIPLFPLLLFGCVGFGGAGLLRGGSWEAVGWGWRIVLALCGLGFLGQVWSALRWQLRPRLANETESRATRVDVAGRVNQSLLGPGPYQTLTRVPGNQIFQVELVEKTFTLPRLPLEWDGLSILHLTDWHLLGTVRREYYEAVCELCEEQPADLILFTGDLLDNMETLDWLPTTLGRLHAPRGRYFILGNHDWYLEPEKIRAAMEHLGWVDLAGTVETLDCQGSQIALGGTERPWMGESPDFSTLPEQTFRMLLSHTPDNYAWAQRQRVDLMLSGHNHGGQVILPVIGPVYSPSVHGVKYAGGTFLENETLLYVSRGLSGRHPLRLNCPPELTRIVLRCPAGEPAADRKLAAISRIS